MWNIFFDKSQESSVLGLDIPEEMSWIQPMKRCAHPLQVMANIQFALHPEDQLIAVIEMNPRMSRSSALASKATSYPIAQIATKIALGYTLDELSIRGMPASMEPVIDYVVVKIPNFQFDKFPSHKDHLFSKMQSIGEVFAIGSSFSSALLKAMRSIKEPSILSVDLRPSSSRLWNIFHALRH